jgi:hypothetical protein
MHLIHQTICILLACTSLAAAPVPEPQGLYTDADAEAFTKTLAGLEVTYPTNFYDVLKRLKIDPERLGKVQHFPGNATDWYRFQLSKSYDLVGTQRLTTDIPQKPPEKGMLRVDAVDIRKRER